MGIVLTSFINADIVRNCYRISKIVNKQFLSKTDITKYAKVLEETKGTKKLGKILGKKNLDNAVLEDTFIRLAVYKKRLSKSEADEMFLHLSGSKGFRTTLKKVVGNSPQKTSGHLNELKIAHNASKNGFKVKAIGEPFVDGVKKSVTDLDVVIKRKGKTFVIEAKDYASNTHIPLDKFRGDMNTLVSYVNKNPSEKIIPIFSMTNKPNNITKMRQLEMIAKKRNIQLIFGTPSQQIEQIKLLGEIL